MTDQQNQPVPVPSPIPAAAATPAITSSVVALVASGLVALGVFLPWVQVVFVSLAGIQGDGIFCLVGAAMGVIGGLDGVLKKQSRTWAGILTLLGGIVGAGIAILVWSRLAANQTGEFAVVWGIGLYLTVIAGIIQLLAGVVIATKGSKK